MTQPGRRLADQPAAAGRVTDVGCSRPAGWAGQSTGWRVQGLTRRLPDGVCPVWAVDRDRRVGWRKPAAGKEGRSQPVAASR